MTTSMIKTGQITQSTLKLLLELCLLNSTDQRMSYNKATCVYDCVCVYIVQWENGKNTFLLNNNPHILVKCRHRDF